MRTLAAAIAPLLPGKWEATWYESPVGAYLASGDMKIFVSAQSGYGEKPGMVRLSPRMPEDYRPGENRVTDIYVSENRPAGEFAAEITRRVLRAQDYAAKAARVAALVVSYRDSEAAARELAGRLGEILRQDPSQDTVHAWPHGTWRASEGTVHLDITLPAELALEVARVIMAADQ
jgi:hypothetical protein